MGKKKAAGPSVDELVTQALVKVATSDGPLRLSGKGDHPALFAKASPVTARLQDETNPLVAVVGSGKAAHVRLTSAGFRQVLPHLPEERVGGLAKALAAGLPAAARTEFLNEVIQRSPAAAPELVPLFEEAVEAEKAEAEARVAEAARRRKAEEASLAAIERWKELVERRRRQRVETLRRELEAEGAEAPEPPAARPAGPSTPVSHAPADRPPRPLAPPETPEDATFRRQVARRLVSSWLDTWEPNHPDARQFLETAMWNMTGFRQIGEPGQEVSFDGELHDGPAGLFPGDRVRVVRPGWALEEGDREYVVAKAVVGT